MEDLKDDLVFGMGHSLKGQKKHETANGTGKNIYLDRRNKHDFQMQKSG